MSTGIPSERRQKTQASEGVERTRSRTVYRPMVDIIESADAVTLLSDMPGVDEKNTDITLDNNVLTVSGAVEPPRYEGYTLAYAEYGVGDYERAFTLSDEIDRDRIEATVKDGVLQVVLPKSKKKEKKITVKPAGS